MFTGIIESVGVITEVLGNGANRSFRVESAISGQLKIDQSVSHNGACLTIEHMAGNYHQVTAIAETLKKTNLGQWKPGTLVNLERCLLINNRLDGHMVQGHVDTTGICTEIKDKGGSKEFSFRFPKKFAPLVIEKGSICINGISLTIFNVKKRSFKVAIIPYTFEHTTMKETKEGDAVNLEFDIIGKYLLRTLSLKVK